METLAPTFDPTTSTLRSIGMAFQQSSLGGGGGSGSSEISLISFVVIVVVVVVIVPRTPVFAVVPTIYCIDVVVVNMHKMNVSHVVVEQ